MEHAFVLRTGAKHGERMTVPLHVAAREREPRRVFLEVADSASCQSDEPSASQFDKPGPSKVAAARLIGRHKIAPVMLESTDAGHV